MSKIFVRHAPQTAMFAQRIGLFVFECCRPTPSLAGDPGHADPCLSVAKCNQINQITYKTGTNPTCPCGSVQLSRVTFTPVTAPPLAPPVIAQAEPVIPEAPEFAPSVKAASKPLKPAHKQVLDALASVKPSGMSLAEELKASKVGKLDQATGARFVNRDKMNTAALDRAALWRLEHSPRALKTSRSRLRRRLI